MTPNPSHDFCIDLFNYGLVRINANQAPPVEDLLATQELIRNVESLIRDNAPGSPPPLDLDAAYWGLSVIEWGCHMLVDRKQADTHLPSHLQEREPSGNTPAQHWSVDLGLRFLTDLLKKVLTAAPTDPLLSSLTEIGSRWPISSVGAEVEWNPERLNIILSDKSLELLLLDRIWLRSDKAHQSHPLLKDRLERHLYLPPHHLEDKVS